MILYTHSKNLARTRISQLLSGSSFILAFRISFMAQSCLYLVILCDIIWKRYIYIYSIFQRTFDPYIVHHPFLQHTAGIHRVSQSILTQTETWLKARYCSKWRDKWSGRFAATRQLFLLYLSGLFGGEYTNLHFLGILYCGSWLQQYVDLK